MIEFNTATETRSALVLDGEPLTIPQVHAIATASRSLRLTEDESVLARMNAAKSLVDRAVEEGWQVYGVTTGFGGMSNVPVPHDLAAASQNNLLAFLSTGAGSPIDRRHVRAAMALRANVLLQGRSGVRLEIVERLLKFLAADIVPVVRELGSIGASGDLVPLAAIARAVTGQASAVRMQQGDREFDSKQALRELRLEPIELHPKEGLAIVNGTSFSSAIAANCIHESRNLFALSITTQAMMLRALSVQDDPFQAFVHQCKPHPGQIWTAEIIRTLLADGAREQSVNCDQVQDRYSLRCLPQYFGPIAEGLARVTRVVGIEMNSVSDNPTIDSENETFYQGGNFLGQYVAMAMDDLRRHLGLLAKHLDVQIAQLVSPEFSRGLSPSLRGNDQLSYNMGLKGLQITGNSIMPLLTYYGNPIVEHFPTHAEQFNQNVNGLSWGAANLAWQSVELFRQYSALSLIFAIQALDLRAKIVLGHFDGSEMIGPVLQPIYKAIYSTLAIPSGQDRPLIFNDADQSLENYVALLHENLSNQGTLAAAISPVLNSFDNAALGE